MFKFFRPSIDSNNIQHVLQSTPVPSTGVRHFNFSTAQTFQMKSMEEEFDSELDCNFDNSDNESLESEAYKSDSSVFERISSEESDFFDSGAMVSESFDSSMSDELCEEKSMGPPRRAGRPRAPAGSTADTARNAQRIRRAQEKRREDRLEKDWRAAVAAKEDQTADLLHQELALTVRGRALFPTHTKTCSELKAGKILAENIKDLNKELGLKSKHRKDIATRVTKGLPPGFCKEVLGFNPTTLRQYRRRANESTEKPALFSEGRSEEKGRVGWSSEFEAQVATFFESRTEILSGANTHTRRLLMRKGRLEVEFHAELPAMLRRSVQNDPGMRPEETKRGHILTAMEKNVLAAEHAAAQPDFSEAEEYKLRLDVELQRRVEQEVYIHLRKKGLIEEKDRKSKTSPITLQEFEPHKHIISGVTSVTLWQIIQRSGIKYTCKIKPHSCPLHDQGPVWELQLKQVIAQLANQPSAMREKLFQRQRELVKKVARFELHLKQYAVCRAALKEAEDALQFGDRKCVVYRDFVNCYNEKGHKVKNLVLVKITRGEDGELIVIKLHNFSSDIQSGCDSYFVSDVFDHHFKTEADGGSGMFNDVDYITLGGDHGPHFASIQTLWDESNFHSEFGKTLVLKFLCSYHAYNRCDGAGVCVKTEANAAAINNCGPISADDYATLMNGSGYMDTLSFTFGTINRSVNVFPNKLNKMPGVKKFCDFVFTHADAKGLDFVCAVGVVRARMLPGVGEYDVFDLVPRPTEWGRMCKPCSGKEQRPVYHKKEGTKCSPAARALVRCGDLKNRRATVQQPDPQRVSGDQVARKRKRAEQESVSPESKMSVPDIKKALLVLCPVHEFAGLKKKALVDLLIQKRAELVVGAGENSQPTRVRAKRRQLPDSDNVEDEENEEKGEESEGEKPEEEECDVDDEGWLLPYDATSQENFIQSGDPVILGWPASRGKLATWSCAIAVEDFEGDGNEIKVQHLSFQVERKNLLCSWVVDEELQSYLAGKSKKPPKELLSNKRPRGHVAYVTQVDVGDILLAGPATAALTAGFLSDVQHRSIREFLDLNDGTPCFGKWKCAPCPACLASKNQRI